MANKLWRGRNAAGLHEHLSLAGLVAICVHGVTLLGDPWLHPGVSGIAVPFTMGYRTVFTGLGILGGYLAAALGLSFYIRRKIGPKLWRKLHRFTVVAYVLVARPRDRRGHRRLDGVAANVHARHGGADRP